MSELSERTAEFRALRNMILEDAGTMVELADDFVTIGTSIIDGVREIPDSVDGDESPEDEVTWLKHHAQEVAALADGVRTARDSLDAYFIAQEFNEDLRALVRTEFNHKVSVLDVISSSLETLATLIEIQQVKQAATERPSVPAPTEAEIALGEWGLRTLYGLDDEDDSVSRVYDDAGKFSHFLVLHD